MKLIPVPYKSFERTPVGHFEASMGADGWEKPKYVGTTESNLMSAEITEFVHLINEFFHECSDWQKLQKYMDKYGTKIEGDDYSMISAINYIGTAMDYIVQVNGANLTIFSYRNIRH